MGGYQQQEGYTVTKMVCGSPRSSSGMGAWGRRGLQDRGSSVPGREQAAQSPGKQIMEKWCACGCFIPRF